MEGEISQHGWQECRKCHAADAVVTQQGAWHLRANPGYWGDSTPETLVLGFSKGANQLHAASRGEFDAVAFARMRPRLQRILDALGIPLNAQSIDHALSATGKGLGAASLIRCGLSLMKNGKLVTSGPVMIKALTESWPRGVAERCVRQHLSVLPPSIRQVVLLGIAPTYVREVKRLMASVFSDFKDISAAAFSASSCVWVFATHPSPANGHFESWVSGPADSGPGRMRALSLAALSAGSARC